MMLVAVNPMSSLTFLGTIIGIPATVVACWLLAVVAPGFLLHLNDFEVVCFMDAAETLLPSIHLGSNGVQCDTLDFNRISDGFKATSKLLNCMSCEIRLRSNKAFCLTRVSWRTSYLKYCRVLLFCKLSFEAW